MTNRKIKRKRAFLSASRGSVTIEAAISITMFMMIVLYFLSFLTMIGKTFERQIFLDSSAKKISKAAFYLEFADKITDHNKALKEKKENFGKIMKKVEKMGLSLKDHVYKDGMVDIKLQYSLNSIFWKYSIPVKQRARIRDWRGTDISERKDVVYITKNGKVYHNNRNCRYLNVKLKTVQFGDIQNLRNQNGGKYYACEICAKEKMNPSEYVCIAKDGNRYHTSIKCSGITRYVITINRKDVGNRKPCSVCGG